MSCWMAVWMAVWMACWMPGRLDGYPPGTQAPYQYPGAPVFCLVLSCLVLSSFILFFSSHQPILGNPLLLTSPLFLLYFPLFSVLSYLRVTQVGSVGGIRVLIRIRIHIVFIFVPRCIGVVLHCTAWTAQGILLIVTYLYLSGYAWLVLCTRKKQKGKHQADCEEYKQWDVECGM
ncbi:hypothetical protein B0J18DRAFT_208679 [Chaetomium sp. MPI-SDFR-AT-0129]|nr:hypothetical protein B0J18DRAFT_208679 [Chaetomium sp. MPI-SDFR-AT-0129]